MTKEQIKEELKTLAIDVKTQKNIARNHSLGSYAQSSAQSKLTTLKQRVRGLLIAYAYIRYKPFSGPEKNAYNEADNEQRWAMVEAKKVLDMTESKAYPSMTVHKPLANKEFDEWITNTVASTV